MLTILGAVLASAIVVFPLARWQMSLSNNTATVSESLDNAGVKLEMMSAMEDRWRQINDMNLDEFKVATNKTTTYGRYTVSEAFETLGKYNSSTGKCDAETPGDDDKACRVATLTVTGPDGVLPLGPVTATRVASAAKQGNIPLGTIIVWSEAKNPDDWKNWHDCNGEPLAGTQLCKKKNICVAPNYQGMFLRGLGGNSAALGVQQDSSVGRHSHYMYYGGYPYAAGTYAGGHGLLKDQGGAQGYTGTTGPGIDTATRSVNVAVRYLIRINN